MDQDNRESWLNRVAAGMAPLFEALGTPLPSRVRVAIGFTSADRTSKSRRCTVAVKPSRQSVPTPSVAAEGAGIVYAGARTQL